MKKLMIAAATVAFGVTAFADTVAWFNGGIEAGWPTSATGGEWTATNGTTYAEGTLSVAAGVDDPVTFEANDAKTIETKKALTISSKVAFTPFSADELPAVPADAKGGVIAVKSGEDVTWYVLWQDGTTNKWTDTEISAVVDVATNISISITHYEDEEMGVSYDYATYTLPNAPEGAVGGQILIGESDRTVQYACYAGDGEVASLSATYEGEVPGPSIPEWLEPTDTENVEKYTVWAGYYGVADPTEAIKEAFLFNVANTEAAVALAESKFKIKGITVEDDVVTLVLPEPADIGVEFFNGEVKARGCATVDGDYLLPDDDENARFFKAFLELIPAN